MQAKEKVDKLIGKAWSEEVSTDEARAPTTLKLATSNMPREWRR